MLVSSQVVEHGGVNIVVRGASGAVMEAKADISATYGFPSALALKTRLIDCTCFKFAPAADLQNGSLRSSWLGHTGL